MIGPLGANEFAITLRAPAKIYCGISMSTPMNILNKSTPEKVLN